MPFKPEFQSETQLFNYLFKDTLKKVIDTKKWKNKKNERNNIFQTSPTLLLQPIQGATLIYKELIGLHSFLILAKFATSIFPPLKFSSPIGRSAPTFGE